MSLPHADTDAEALPDEDADTAALSELHTNRDEGDPITNPDKPAVAHADICTERYTSPDYPADINQRSDEHADPADADRTVAYSDFTVTLDDAGRHIAAVTHTHDDGSEHDAIPIFTGPDCAYDCFDCGATFKPVVWRSEFKDIRR